MAAYTGPEERPTILVELPVGAPARVPWWRSSRNLIRAAVPIAILIAWELVSSTGLMSRNLLPAPIDVLDGARELWTTGALQEALPVSLGRAGIGFAIGLSIGLLFGILNGLSVLAEQVFDSTLQIVRLVPFIALAPLLIAWFGIGETYKFLLIALACVFPAYLNTYAAVRNVDPRLIEAGRVFGLSRRAIVRSIVFPAAWPGIVVGVRYAMGISLLALIIAEQTNATSGIGYLISQATVAIRLDLIMVGVVVYALLGIAVDVVMRVIEKKSMPWL